jgi:transcription antitermination factor NusG
LQTQGIISYCPVREEEHKWADRKKMVEVPLFTSYLFVKINPREESKVRQTLGVINFVYFQGKPAIVQDSVIDDIKHYLSACPDMDVINFNELSVGDRVRVKSGAFVDQEGQVLEIQGKHVLMSLDNLKCVLVARVHSSNIVTA